MAMIYALMECNERHQYRQATLRRHKLRKDSFDISIQEHRKLSLLLISVSTEQLLDGGVSETKAEGSRKTMNHSNHALVEITGMEMYRHTAQWTVYFTEDWRKQTTNIQVSVTDHVEVAVYLPGAGKALTRLAMYTSTNAWFAVSRVVYMVTQEPCKPLACSAATLSHNKLVSRT